MKTGLVPRHDCLGIPVIVQISRTYYRTPQGLVEGSVVEAQQSGTLIAGEARDIGPMLWGLLHGLAMSNYLVAVRVCQPEASYRFEDMQRILALALKNLAPR
ncbi:hypothetical protein [Rhodococcus sp. MS16]|nr:hypothetical protein [Rhodococcus sp. MS16]